MSELICSQTLLGKTKSIGYALLLETRSFFLSFSKNRCLMKVVFGYIVRNCGVLWGKSKVWVCAYIGDVPLQLHNSCHLLSDAGLIYGQSPVGADKLSQVNHELLVGSTCLSNTCTFMILTSWLQFSWKEKMFGFNQRPKTRGNSVHLLTDTYTHKCGLPQAECS